MSEKHAKNNAFLEKNILSCFHYHCSHFLLLLKYSPWVRINRNEKLIPRRLPPVQSVKENTFIRHQMRGMHISVQPEEYKEESSDETGLHRKNEKRI